jgi:predicted site-specific integrase-resolvase
MDDQIPPLLHPREVDRLLRYPRGRTVRLAREGKIPAVFLPDGEVRFNPRDIEALVRSRPINGRREGGGRG